MIYEEQHLYHVVGVEIKRLVGALPKVIQQVFSRTSSRMWLMETELSLMPTLFMTNEQWLQKVSLVAEAKR